MDLPTHPFSFVHVLLFLFPFSFVTMKVHIEDENFLTPACFVSDRAFPVCFWQTKSVLGALDLFGPFLTFFWTAKTLFFTKMICLVRTF